jgi:hypothetical protein
MPTLNAVAVLKTHIRRKSYKLLALKWLYGEKNRCYVEPKVNLLDALYTCVPSHHKV